MLMQYDLDMLMQSIQSGEDTYIYYIEHMVQAREGKLDECQYKSVSGFKVVKVQVTDINNAWYEYIDYVNNPDNYHVETETEYYDRFTTYTHYYTVKNLESSYTLDINARIPSIIYGIRRVITKRYGDIVELNDPTPVKEIYTNALAYGDLRGDDITAEYNAGNLDWKYMTLDTTANVDGVEYKYLTSNYFILTLKDYPMVEKPLIYANKDSAYFMDVESAYNHVQQLLA